MVIVPSQNMYLRKVGVIWTWATSWFRIDCFLITSIDLAWYVTGITCWDENGHCQRNCNNYWNQFNLHLLISLDCFLYTFATTWWCLLYPYLFIVSPLITYKAACNYAYLYVRYSFLCHMFPLPKATNMTSSCRYSKVDVKWAEDLLVKSKDNKKPYNR